MLCILVVYLLCIQLYTTVCIFFIVFLFYIGHIIWLLFNPFAPGDFAEKRVLKLVEWFSGHCRAIKS